MTPPAFDQIPPGLRDHLARRYPLFRLASVAPLSPDSGATPTTTAKANGYGRSAHLTLRAADGGTLELVWRLATANELGHDRRSDRAANQLLAFDDFAQIPHHIEALDVGAVGKDGELISLRDATELYLITSYARGKTYAEDLRAVASARVASERDHARATALASYLAKLHVAIADPPRYRRAIRDLVGHGEGIYGIIDHYPGDVPGASTARLQAIERSCAEWRWRLRRHEDRLVRSHGDFHPFNVIFDDGVAVTTIDASRGACGDAADDVTAMAINYVLFALDAPDAWLRGLGPLWRRFWDGYLDARPDPALLACAPPFLAWRALVVCNPRFYPALSAGGREALLGLVEATLAAGHFDPRWAEALFT